MARLTDGFWIAGPVARDRAKMTRRPHAVCQAGRTAETTAARNRTIGPLRGRRNPAAWNLGANVMPKSNAPKDGEPALPTSASAQGQDLWADDIRSSRTSCEVCGSRNLSPLMEALDRTGFRFSLVYCGECGLIQIERVIADATAGVWYEGEWWKDRKPSPPKQEIPKPWIKMLGQIRRYGGGTGKLLDVGCGAGEFLRAARMTGFEAFGVDVCEPAVQWVRDSYQIPCYTSVEEAARQQGPFDAITCMETIYYFRRPALELARLRAALKPGGILMVKCQANRAAIFWVARWLAGLGGRKLVLRHTDGLYAHTGQGFYIYSTSALCRLLRQGGFHALSIRNEHRRSRYVMRLPTILAMMGNNFFKTVSTIVSALTLGRVKIGPCIVVYAARTEQ